MAENSVFAEIHHELSAKLVPCGKWNLPLFYPGGSLAEHRNIHASAGIFDQTGTRAFQVAGRDVVKVLEHSLLRPVSFLPVGGSMDNCLLYEDGTIAMVFTLCRMQENDFMFLIMRGTDAAAVKYFTGLFSPSLEIRELTEAMAFLTVAGKTASTILSTAGADSLPQPGCWQMITLADEDGDIFRCIAIRHDRFGETAFDLCCNVSVALEVYAAIYRINGVTPAGISAWESMRLEGAEPGIPEFSGGVSPSEAALSAWISPSRKFIGSNAPLITAPRSILALSSLERHPLPAGSAVTLSDDLPAGVVTSSAFCPISGSARHICRIPSVEGVSKISCVVNDLPVSLPFSIISVK